MNFSVPAMTSRCVWRLVLLSVVVVLALVFLLPADLYLSAPGTDLTGQFIAWRAFAVDNILGGHFPLWNPYTYGGQPFLGDFQSAELYPPNVIFLFLPMARAVNLSFLLHLLFLGWGVAYWGSRRGWHFVACAITGLTAALSGPVFLHLYAGHLSNISSLAWAPWILAFFENAWRGPARKPLLLASASVCLQILGGHVQYAFYTGVAAGLFAVVQTFHDRTVRLRALPMVAVVYLAAALLVAVQLLPGLSAVSESVRQGKLDFSFVSMIPFPPENLITAFMPWFFGGMATEEYWGRSLLLWEASVFIGVSGVVLVFFALSDKDCRRKIWPDLVVAALLFVIALGSHTPLLHFLYDYVPGFGLFRAVGKFTFPALLFTLLALGAGADALVRGQLPRKAFAFTVLGFGVLLLAGGIYLESQPAAVDGLRAWLASSHENYLGAPGYPPAPPVEMLGLGAAHALLLAGGVAGIIGIGFIGTKRWPQLRWAPLLLLPVEMLGFAWSGIGVAHNADVVPQIIKSYIAKNPGDYRVLDAERANEGYILGAPDLWGNDPTVLLRYAEFINYSQGRDPNHSTQYTSFTRLPHIFSIIRFRMAILHTGGDKYNITDNPGALPRVLLVPGYQVLPGRDAIFAELFQPNFDPRQKVLLETAPSFQPQTEIVPGTVQITELSSDSLTLEADISAPAILLITDLFSRDWHVRALPDSSQAHYDLVPGDYILRAIPLSAGHHHLVVEYLPATLRWGMLVSGVAWVIWLSCWFWPTRTRVEFKGF